MLKFEIRAALGGGFGGINMQDPEIIEANTLEEAEQYAYEKACEGYDSYAGMHGLASYDSIAEENPDFSEQDIECDLDQERESWLEYEAKEIK